MRGLLIGLIRVYQYLFSPWLGQHCRFHPSCSHYAVESIRVHGPLTGSLLALRRLGRCHPWHEGGYDPVPPLPSPFQSHLNTVIPSKDDDRLQPPSTIDVTGHG